MFTYSIYVEMFIRLLHNKFILPHFKLPTYFMVVLFRHANVILKHILLILIFWLYLALSKFKYYPMSQTIIPKFAVVKQSLHTELKKRVQAYFDEKNITSAGTPNWCKK